MTAWHGARAFRAQFAKTKEQAYGKGGVFEHIPFDKIQRNANCYGGSVQFEELFGPMRPVRVAEDTLPGASGSAPASTTSTGPTTSTTSSSSSSATSSTSTSTLRFPSTANTVLMAAPMVDGSELAFRQMARKYGTQICYTPMVHGRIFGTMSDESQAKRPAFLTCASDRPLVVQFCGNDPDELLKAAQYVQWQCDAVDLNLGCPQRIASTGNYGAFLMQDPDTVESIVRKLSQSLEIPVWCKIRVLETVEATVDFARMLYRAGCSLLAIHGRTRDQRTKNMGMADATKIRAVAEALADKMPIVSNGNVLRGVDVPIMVEACRTQGHMCAWALLRNPRAMDETREALKKANAGEPRGPEWDRLSAMNPTEPFYSLVSPVLPVADAVSVTREYLEHAVQYGAPRHIARKHVFSIMREHVDANPSIRKLVAEAKSIGALEQAMVSLLAIVEASDEATSVDEPNTADASTSNTADASTSEK